MKKYVPLIVRCGIVLLLVVLLIVLSILKNNQEVCEAMSRGLSRFIVGVMGKGSEVASFSLDDVNLKGWWPEEVKTSFGDVFEMTEDIILLRRKYKMPVINIYGKKDDNSAASKRLPGKYISGQYTR